MAHAREAKDSALSFLEQRVTKDPDDFTAQNQLASRYLELLRTTGDDVFRTKARHAAQLSVSAVIPEFNNGGLALLAQVQLASHDFAGARDTAERLRAVAPNKDVAFAILGDALFELGDYDKASEAYSNLARANENDFEVEPRLARLAFVHGQLDEAARHLGNALKAVKPSSPPAASSAAWCAVQLGQLYFGRGDWRNAEKQYQAALTALPDFWMALDHLAELRGAQQRYAEAIGIYKELIERVPRPELCQAMGDLLLFMGKPDEAKPWHQRAESGYRKTADQRDPIYDHHLAGFYSDSIEDPAEAVRWARKDLSARHSVFAFDALAWALYRAGEFSKASAEMQQTLALGTRDAHLFFHAGMIAAANGNLEQSKEFLAGAAEVNPRYNTFHVHR
jgi:tetratricopeptide (TPR) repeat protein